MPTLFPESLNTSLKELLAYSLLAAAGWICSFTIGSPLFVALVVSSSLRNKFFAFIFPLFLRKCSRYHSLPLYRKRLFDLIKEHTSSNGQRSTPIKILEVGGGSGENFAFYPENHSLTMVDMNPEFGSILKSTLKKYPQIQVEKIITARAEDMSFIQDGEFDVVATTYVMCSVTDVDAALSEIYRVLKKGGKYAFMEHVVYPKQYFWAYMIQRFVTPMGKIYANGCNINRNVLMNVKMSRFSQVSYKMYYPNFLDIFFRPTLMGVCTK